MTKLAAVLVLLLASLVVMSSASPMSISKRGTIRLCGNRLVETLYMVCGGEFYGPNIQVRSAEDDGPADYYSGWMLPPSRQGGADLRPRISRRQLQGVVDECCKKSCSFPVLSSYCGK